MKRYLLCLLFLPLSAIAQTVPVGWVDNSFGRNGADTINDAAIALLSVFNGDSLIAVGNGGAFNAINISKFDNNGHACTSFGVNGSILLYVPGYENNVAQSVIVQPDAKLLIAGWGSDTDSNPATSTFDDFLIVRLMPDGSFDTSFHNTGVLGADFDHQENTLLNVVLQPNGKILACGKTTTDTGQRLELARFNSNGSIDSAFGSAGRAEVPIGSNNTGTYAVVQPDGKIIVSSGLNIAGTYYTVFMRFDTTGILDSTFGVNGQNMTLAPPYEGVFSLHLLPSGEFLTSGGTQIARYNSDGSPDSTFATNGVTSFDAHGSASAYVCYISVAPDGKIVYAITVDSSQILIETLARFNSNGTLDTTFGTGGIIRNYVSQAGSSYAYVRATQVQSDNKIIAGSFLHIPFVVEAGILTRYFQSSTGISSVGNNFDQFTLYPNPAVRDVTITSSILQGKALLHILDMNGRLVQAHELQFEHGEARVHTDLIPGIYATQLIDEQNGHMQTEKLVIAQ